MLGAAPTIPQDIYDVFVRYVQGAIPHIPWCESPLQPESLLIQKQLMELNAAGFLTINSQPAVNGMSSDDPVVGWGGAGGYVYQKEYCEFFCSPSHVVALKDAITAGNHSSLNLYAVNSHGQQQHILHNNNSNNGGGDGVTALTWGVFPNREIVQPTIFDPQAFLMWWAEEAFSLWKTVWLPLYKEGSPTSRALIEEIYDTYYLVAVIDNDFIGGSSTAKEESRLLWNVMLESAKKVGGNAD